LRAVRMDLSQGSLAYYATSQNGSSKSAAEGNHSPTLAQTANLLSLIIPSHR
jgi:hypothetical protein